MFDRTTVRNALFLFVILYASPVCAQLTGGDYCQSANPGKTSAVINASGVGESLLVAAVPNQVTQVCGVTYDIGGTTPSIEFDYASRVSADCDTGATALTGAMTAATRTLSGPLDNFHTPPGKQLCIKLAGTNPTAVGVLTYVQK